MLNKKTIIIKISGAALKDDNNDSILSTDKLLDLAQQIKELSEFNNVVIINGGGNIWRGGTVNKKYCEEEQAHYMGMIATVINAVAIKEVLLKVNVNTVVYSLLDVPAVAKKYNIANVKKDLSLNKVIILGGGTGKPFFTTDTGATKVAKELGIKLIVVGKDGTDGVYSDDPKINKKAIRYSHLSISDAIKQNLKFMDLSAMKMCKAEKINLLIFNIQRKKAIVNAIKHKIPTTIIEAK